MVDDSGALIAAEASRLTIERIIDVLAKLLTILAVSVYGSGFLVSSLYQYEYGFIDANPFRPRVLSAGIWFIMFLSIPFLLNIESRNIATRPGKFQTWIQKPSSQTIFITAVSYWLGRIFSPIFDVPPEQTNGSGMFSSLVAFSILSAGGVLFAFDFWGVIGKRLSQFGSIALFAYFCAYGAHDALVFKRASGATVTLWILLMTWFAVQELNSRSWKWKVGNWLQSVSLVLAALTTFATFYYPNMKASWGGGSPIPATLYFTKDSAIMPNQSVKVQLLETTDAGVYVLGAGEKKATFIPRNNIGLIYYAGDTSGIFIPKPK